MKRIYQALLEDHLAQYDQMAFLSGPRQVGKTTIAHALQTAHQNSCYVNWDALKDRDLILSGYENIVGGLHLDCSCL